jgi:EAL domain-containing protein (putative c-di-GMP-specific phosphodiesterase class I)
MNQQVQKTFVLEKDLRQALYDGEFSNLYQPIINGTSKTVDGFEVSIKWPEIARFDSQDAMLCAAQTGLCKDIFLYTLERALIELKQWHCTHPELYISLNLSSLDLFDVDLVEKVDLLFKRLSVQGKYVAFEVSESLMMGDTARVIESMYQLKVLGCRLFMDDFGTGYASLTQLKRFPIDVLKVAHNFVVDIGVDKEHEVIIHSSLSLAHSLGMQCVAQGISTKEQLRFLRMHDCDYFQGPLFGEALGGEHVATLLENTWQPIFS